MISLKNVVCAFFYVYIFDFITHFYNPLFLLHLHLLTLIGLDGTMMELGTVIAYLKKIQKIYESRGTPLYFC